MQGVGRKNLHGDIRKVWEMITHYHDGGDSFMEIDRCVKTSKGTSKEFFVFLPINLLFSSLLCIYFLHFSY